MRASERQRASGNQRPAWPGNAVRGSVARSAVDGLAEKVGVAAVPGTYSLRWILVHMVEEYARHCGHADLLRQAIDGTTGD